jgi:hypothetical protein
MRAQYVATRGLHPLTSRLHLHRLLHRQWEPYRGRADTLTSYIRAGAATKSKGRDEEREGAANGHVAAQGPRSWQQAYRQYFQALLPLAELSMQQRVRPMVAMARELCFALDSIEVMCSHETACQRAPSQAQPASC